MGLNQTDKFTIEIPDTGMSASSDPNQTPEMGWSLDKGVTRENNEDSLAAVTLNRASKADAPTIGVYAVADGMGGHQAGEVASQLAVRTAVRKLMGDMAETGDDMPENYRQWLESAVALANRVVREKAHEKNTDMGTTLVIAVVVGQDVHIASVGDSRAYLISPTTIRQITHDQTFAQALVDTRAITPEQATHHPNRNVLTQAVGRQEEVIADLFKETLGDADSLLLCSDGLWSTLGDDEIVHIVRTAATADAACQALVDACNAKGSLDNIAAVLIRPEPVGVI